MSEFKSGGLGKGKYKKGDKVLIDGEQLATVKDMEVPNKHLGLGNFYKLITPTGSIEYSYEDFLEPYED